MTIASSTDVFFDQLTDLDSATQQTAQTLPQLIEWSTDPKLREALHAYQSAIARHTNDIQSVFAAHSRQPGNDTCKAIAGLIEGGNAHIQAAGDAIVRDCLIIAHSNRIGHYIRAATEFTLGVARRCRFAPESDTLAEMLARQQDFTSWLAEVAALAFDVEMGGVG